jgi:hypothetical protein
MDTRHFLPDVLAQFRSLNRRGDRIGVLEGFPREFRDKRYSVFHNKGGRDNHFQGVERLGRYLLVTGSFPYGRRRSDLLVVRLDSRPADPGPWGSNLLRSRVPPATDRLVNYFRIDDDYWHPGGLDLLGNIAVIPLEQFDNTSKITFVDLSNPEAPVRRQALDIERDDAKAGACAITPLADGRLLLAVWSDSDKTGAPFHLDLYLSTDQAVDSGFELAARFVPDQMHRFHRRHQCLDFVWQRGPDREHLYLVGFENTSDAQPSPFGAGENKAYLFEVDLAVLPNVTPGAVINLPASFLSFMDEHQFGTSGNWCNMDAGACAYVDSNQQLIVYSVFHFLAKIGGDHGGEDPVLKCLEFRATDFSPIALIEDAWVDLYEQAGLEGRRLSILGPWNASIQDTSLVFVDDLPVLAARSIRYQLPEGTSFVLYPLIDFQGAPALVLTGSGRVENLDVLATPFSGQFRSCQLQPSSVAIVLPNAIVH